MLPGKKYTVDDVMKIVRRRYWLLLVPCAILGAASAEVARTTPNQYEAETVIMVIPQSVPETYVQPIVTARIEDRLSTLRTTILSRTRLEGIIERFNLYPGERRLMPMEDVVELMRSKIWTETAGRNSFTVRFRGYEPQQVMQVTDSLASLFIDESLRDRQAQAEGTNDFLESSLEDARTRLQEQERRLADWKARNAGELPSQVEDNRQQILTAQMALRDLREAMNADRALRLERERQLDDLQKSSFVDDAATSVNPATEQAIASATAGTSQQLRQAEAALAALNQRGLKPGHPDWDAANRRVQDLTARLQREIAGVSSNASAGTLSPAELARQSRVQALKREIAQLDAQIARSQEEERRFTAVSLEAQRRVDATPRRETEYIELTRDYDMTRRAYDELLANKKQAEIAASLERRQVGEQFKLLDPAQLPERPVSPNRPREIIVGAIVGLLLGAGLVGLLEYRDKSFKTDEDIASVLDLPVLAIVPVMKTDDDVRRGRWRTAFLSVGLGAMVTGCLAFAAYVAVS